MSARGATSRAGAAPEKSTSTAVSRRTTRRPLTRVRKRQLSQRLHSPKRRRPRQCARRSPRRLSRGKREAPRAGSFRARAHHAKSAAGDMPRRVFIGTAGWSVPRAWAHRCPGDGTHLERYSNMFRCAEINSSFHRPHSAATYSKWAGCTPDAFRFAVKIPRTITHDRKLKRARRPLETFLRECAGLGRKRGPILVQLPPSLSFEARRVRTFFQLIRSFHPGAVICEPRHETWFAAEADRLMMRFKVARVAADPAPAPGGDLPGAWPGIVYYRLHGSPRKYWSKYESRYLERLAAAIRQVPASVDVWCVFDNTASGAALENAWELRSLFAAANH